MPCKGRCAISWTAPRTYVANEIVTAALLNVDLRDNLTALSTHAHAGAAGDGNDELSGLDVLAFDDLAASPSVAGRLQRNGVNLEWYGAAVVAITQADAPAATASPRTLGTGALQGAPGTHGHSLSGHTVANNNVSVQDAAANIKIDAIRAGRYNVAISTTTTLITYATGARVGAIHIQCYEDNNTGNGSHKISIEVDGVEVVSYTNGAGADTGNIHLIAVGVKATADLTFAVKLQNNATDLAAAFMIGNDGELAVSSGTSIGPNVIGAIESAKGDLAAA